MGTEISSPLKILGAVAVVAAVATAIVTGSYELSRDRITANERARLLSTLQEAAGIAPGTRRLAAVEVPIDPAVHSADGDPTSLFALFDGNDFVVSVLAIAAPDGYNGPIRMLVGIGVDGTIAGVRVIGHKETPGLGDFIERAKSDWIDQFTGFSLRDPQRWAVDKDGGSFDSLTGATITPRAIVRAVQHALDFFDRNSATLIAEARRRHEADHEQ